MNNNNYGYVFSNIEVNGNILKKSAKNEEGKRKIMNEILFYKNIIENKIDFPIPKIYNLNKEDGIIEMEYLKDFYKTTSKMENIDLLDYNIKKILYHIEKLHNFTSIEIDTESFKKHIDIETKYKLIKRYNETNWSEVPFFNNIESVNNIKIGNIYDYVDILNNKIHSILNSYKKDFVFIHGDIHLGNILTNDKNEIYFIDPRGIFGESRLYGLKHYDYAKLLFGISGYSVFDEMEINSIDIKNNNINIEFIEKYYYIYDSDIFDEITKLLSLTIWLSNNSCFIDNNKKLLSLMIAFYYCEKYLHKK